MAKQIVFCADGTWNGPGASAGSGDIDTQAQQDGELHSEVTNVFHLFANLDGQITPATRELPQETEKALVDAAGSVLQVAKYLHGVGDSSNPILKVLGGVLGVGVIARIVRGYTFLSRNYEPGDSVHIIGFSRGAYTARALAGMIANVGLLNKRAYDPDDKVQAYLRGFEAWLKCKGVVFNGNNRFSSMLTALTDFAEGAVARVLLSDADFIPDVQMRSVAVWDTVGSMGIPEYIGGARHDFFSFVDLKLSPKVDRGFHAMALDERWLDFPVTRWDADPRVDQMWFIGAHSDVGGGYPSGQCGLSDIALDWMMQNLSQPALGVRFANPGSYIPALDGGEQPFHTPWLNPPFNIAPKARTPLAGDAFHPSVQRRWLALPTYQQDWPKQFIAPLPPQTSVVPPLAAAQS